MKQHFFTRGGILLAIMSVFLSFFACRQDQIIDASPPSVGAAFKQSARQYYDNTLATLRKANIDKTKTDAQFTALDLTPDWEAAISHNKNGKTYLEVPVKFGGNGTIVSSGSSTITQFNPNTDIPIPVRLIISKSDNGLFTAGFMGIRSELPYSNGIVPNFDLFKKIDNFSGREYIFNLDGSFDKGWIHKDGQIVSSLIKIKNNIGRLQSVMRLCSAWFEIGANGQILRQLTDWECSSNGGSFFGVSTNGNGSGSGSWGNSSPPGDCNGTSGTTCDDIETVHFAGFETDEYQYDIASITYSHSIAVTNCPLMQYTSNPLTYKTKKKLGFNGSLQSLGESSRPLLSEPIDKLKPRGGFRTKVHCEAHPTFTLWAGPWGGIPLEENMATDAAYFVQ